MRSEWHCLNTDCTESGEHDDQDADRPAERHVKATGHSTVTRTWPVKR